MKTIIAKAGMLMIIFATIMCGSLMAGPVELPDRVWILYTIAGILLSLGVVLIRIGMREDRRVLSHKFYIDFTASVMMEEAKTASITPRLANVFRKRIGVNVHRIVHISNYRQKGWEWCKRLKIEDDFYETQSGEQFVACNPTAEKFGLTKKFWFKIDKL